VGRKTTTQSVNQYNGGFVIDGAAGEHHVVDDCEEAPSSAAVMFNTGMLHKALHPLQQQQHEIAEQLTALNARLSSLQAGISNHSSDGLRAAGLLNGSDIFIVAALLLLQLIMLWWLVNPGSSAKQKMDTQ